MNEFQDQILDHYHNPRNFGKPTWEVSSSSFQQNLSCGDEVKIYLKINDDKVIDINIIANGCSISIATTSLLSEYFKNKKISFIKNFTIDEVIKIIGIPLTLSRIRCASLSLDCFKNAISS